MADEKKLIEMLEQAVKDGKPVTISDERGSVQLPPEKIKELLDDPRQGKE